MTAMGAVTGVQTGDASRQQAVISFVVADPAQCTIVLYRDAAMTDPVDDTNNSVFSGSESCNRPFNVVDGHRVAAVIGRRIAEPGNDGKTRYSRSLEAGRAYYFKIRDLTDGGTATGTVSTDTLPWADTHPETPAFDAGAPDRYAYPTIDWSDAAQSKGSVDPLTGMLLQRGPRNLNGGTTPELPFSGAFGSGWTNTANALNHAVTGPFASYSGTAQSPLMLTISPDLHQFRYDYFSPVAMGWNSQYLLDDLKVNVYGYATPTGNAEDSKVLVCMIPLWNPSLSQTCAAEIETTLPNSPALVAVPTNFPQWQFAGWQMGHYLTGDEVSVYMGTKSQASGENCTGGAATVSNSVVTLTGSSTLPPFAAAGMKINIAGTWYTIGQENTAQNFTLAEPNVNIAAESTWFMGSWAIRIRKKTTAANAIYVGAGWAGAYSGDPDVGANGVPDFCSRLTFDVSYAADGVTPITPKKGRLCVLGTGMNKWFAYMLADDGETRYLSNLKHTDYSYRGSPIYMPLGSFHAVNPYALVAQHTDDTAGGDATNWALYEVTYDAARCKFKAWPGNAWGTQSTPDDCLQWISKMPSTQGKSLTQLWAPKFTADPWWNQTWEKKMQFGGLAGKYAVFWTGMHDYSDNPRQDAICYISVVDTTDYSQVKFFNTLDTLPSLRWSACHSTGIEYNDRTKWGSIGTGIIGNKTDPGYLSGPFVLKAITAKSLDGGSTWTADTSLTNVAAANCGTNPYGVTGLQCVKLKIASDRPCSARGNASDPDVVKWPCPWSKTTPNWTITGTDTGTPDKASPMVFQAGDYISWLQTGNGQVDGKAEKMRVLTKTSDGAGGWIVEVQRWAACDNIDSDPAKGAVYYYDHLYGGTSGSARPNGWIGVMTPTGTCAGNSAWVDLSVPLDQTVVKIDASAITASHNTLGRAPNGVDLLQVGPSSTRIGSLPTIADNFQMAANFNVVQWSWDTVRLKGYRALEQYPSLGNWDVPTAYGRSMYYDFRHINPDNGSSPGYEIGIWSQSYTKVSGTKWVYKVGINQDFVTNHKSWRPVTFSSRGAFQDLSGPGALIDDTNLNSYCFPYKNGECRPDSVADGSSVYVVSKNPHIETGACVTDTYVTFTPCVSYLEPVAGWAVGGDATRDDPNGVLTRRFTMGLTGPAAQFQYTSPHMTSDGKWMLVRAGWPNGVRARVLLGKVPSVAVEDSIDRSRPVAVKVVLPSGSGYVRARFGYIENGSAAQFYCTSRKEACLTDASVQPYAFEQSDPLTATDCRNGCTVSIPALSGRVLYYRIEKSAEGSTGWAYGPTQVKAIK
jgi:hypothetical protein